MIRKSLMYIFIFLTLLALIIGGYLFYHQWRHEVFVAPTYDTDPPQVPDSDADTRVLVFSKTNSFRHVDGIPSANAMFQQFAEDEGWELFFTENAAVHTQALLDRFDLAVWNNVSGDVLTPDQRAAFRAWLESGGVVLAIHATGGSPVYEWDWYPSEFIRAQFTGHPLVPQFQTAIVEVEAPEHPAMQHLPQRWEIEDEWYTFKTSPRERVHVLATLDEASYNPALAGPFGDLAMGDHPIIWHHDVGEGTVFYSALGHQAKTYEDEHYRELLLQASRWLLNRPAAE